MKLKKNMVSIFIVILKTADGTNNKNVFKKILNPVN
jgi:hypothetical protein